MIAYNNIQAFVLTCVPLGIALILFFTRYGSVRAAGEKIQTYDYILMSFVGVSFFTALSSVFEIMRGSVNARIAFILLINLFTYLFTYFFLEYAIEILFDTKQSKALTNISRVLFVASILVICWSIQTGRCFWFDEQGFYHRGDLYILTALYPALVTVLAVAISFYADTSRKNRVAFSSYSIIAVLCLAIQSRYDGLSMAGLGLSAVILILYCNVIAEKNVAYFKMKSILAEEELSRMQGQMKPHFMYNTLSSIQELCYESPKDAEEALSEFTSFIRGNMDYMEQREPVSILKEIDFTRHYVNLEKFRFGDRINAEFDIEEIYFTIPPLTVQPLVENAIRYGLLSRMEGGTIKISTKKIEDEFYVIVEDDGIGFNNVKDEVARSHIGLRNLKKRIELGCGGRVELETEDNVGTKISIILPSKMSTKGV